MSALDAARESIRKAEDDFNRNGQNHSTGGRWARRDELTQQWLKLAAIEAGLNPWQPQTQGEVTT